MKSLTKNVGIFALISLVGWVGDLLLFMSLLHLVQIGPFWSNFISSIVMATCVFIIFQVFVKRQQASLISAAIYAVYQIALISLVSRAIEIAVLTAQQHADGLMYVFYSMSIKVIATGFTFICNFLVSSFMTRRRQDVSS